MRHVARSVGWTGGWRVAGPRTLGEVMQTKLVHLHRDDRLMTAIAHLRTRGAHFGVAVSGRLIEGVLVQQDLDALSWMLRGSGRGRSWVREMVVEDVMRTPPLILPPDATVAMACRVLGEGARECIVVVSEGNAVGIVTEADLHTPFPTDDARLQGGVRAV
jgi:CBS domain-containing protein